MYFRVFIKFRVCTCIHDTRYTISTSFVYTRSHLCSQMTHVLSTDCTSMYPRCWRLSKRSEHWRAHNAQKLASASLYCVASLRPRTLAGCARRAWHSKFTSTHVHTLVVDFCTEHYLFCIYILSCKISLFQ